MIALGLVLLPTLALALLVRGVLEADEEAQLREARERRERVQGRVEDLAGRLAARPELFQEEHHEPLLLREAVPPLALLQPVEVDGDCSDWRAAEVEEARAPVCAADTPASARFERAEPWVEDASERDPTDASFRLTAGARDAEGYLYLFLRVRDDDVRVRRGAIENADQLRLAVSLPWGEAAMIPARFVAALESGGELTTYQVGPTWRREVTAERLLSWGDYRAPAWRRPYGVWRATGTGYDLELRLPLRSLGARWREARLGLALLDVDAGLAGLRQQALWVEPARPGTLGPASPVSEPFQQAWPSLDLPLRERRVAIFDARGRELFASFAPGGEAAELRARAVDLLQSLARSPAASLAHPEAALAAARIADAGGRTLGFAFEDAGAEPPSRTLADVARESPGLAAVLAAALLLLFLLLAYTGRLSRRILALVDDVGADRGADDEIGELSRRLSDLVEQVRADRAYLERLPAILGHETLGPLGVVKMFLDDLGSRELPKQEAARRALRSVEELIEDLREATSLEEALARGERVETDLVELVRESLSAYAESKRASIQMDLPPPGAGFLTTLIEGRVEQLLDKLLDNAVEFSAGAPVQVAVSPDPAQGLTRIRVENQGPPLPEGAAAEKLFEPLWSQRKRTSARHLGMGLYVARLIAERHGGTIRAHNEPPDRVVFEVTLRRADA